MEGKIVMGGSDIAVIDVTGIFIMVAMVSGIVLYAVRWATYAADQTLEASSRDWDKKNQRKKRIYISGPITGISDYMKRFEEAEKCLEMLGYQVVNPAKIGKRMPSDTTYEGFMEMSLQELSKCDEIYMLENWEKSLGANREYGYAIARKMPVLRARLE